MDALDPLLSSSLSADELAQLADSNDAAVAQSSLNAQLTHWQDQRPINCKDWLVQLIHEVTPLAESLNLSSALKPLDALLNHGNQAMRWEEAHAAGQSIDQLLQEGIQLMHQEEQVPTGEPCLG